jgi:hypothetical protein
MWKWTISFTPRPVYPPGKEPPVPNGNEAGWAPEPVWTLYPNRESNPHFSAVHPVAHYHYYYYFIAIVIIVIYVI